MLKGKNIVLGVTGGIAAYKSCTIVSNLKKLGANVNVIMTKSATEFVNPNSFQALSQNPVITDLFDTPRYWDIEHISLAQKADILLIAPASANIIGKVASGIADDMLSTTIMASSAKVVFAPAMNTKMYENPIFKSNMQKLLDLGYYFISPQSGRLACGDVGNGKMEEPDTIVKFILDLENRNKDLLGKNIMVTAGPTVEPIDPVRYISNPSTGKMGYAIAEAAKNRGANVTLISGPTHIKKPSDVNFISVDTTINMYNKVLELAPSQDVIIKTAAVSDYRAQIISDKKIKKNDETLTLNLVKNPDILLELGKIKTNQILVGFAAETDNIIENAKDKIKRKNLDFIVANDVTQEGAGFAHDTNSVNIIDKHNNISKIPLKSKQEIAHQIIDKVVDLLNNL